ncbi:membrane protein RL12 [Human betaherpesvirus 5]|uniref:Membrane protein RL12 n=1 Tax=Human cytomegalovirus TaxID=10359 RepID=C8BL89_HCMV|nr:membrane protein RL12 [Human betaherpesvirus 5]
MRVACRRPHHLTYRHTAYTIIIFYILHRVTCNSTTTNTASITSPNTASTTFVTSVFSTPNNNTSTTPHTSVTSQASTIGNITNVTSDLSTFTTVYSTFNTSYANISNTAATTELILTNTNTILSFTNATSSYNTTITVTITSDETSHNVSTNTALISTPWLTNCSATTYTTYNRTNSSNACHTETTIIRFKETNTTGIEGSNVTIKGNSTWDCLSVAWIRHYNRSTHGHHLGHRKNAHTQSWYWLRILTSHTVCHSQHERPSLYHDLCRSCNNTELHLYDLNITNSGRYSRRCFKENYFTGHHEDENFYLLVTPKNHTEAINATFVCPRYNTDIENEDREKGSQHTNNTHHHKRNLYHSSQRSRTVWTIVLVCMACIVLFFARRAFNKKYHMLQDTVSESEFIVRYHTEHED